MTALRLNLTDPSHTANLSSGRFVRLCKGAAFMKAYEYRLTANGTNTLPAAPAAIPGRRGCLTGECGAWGRAPQKVRPKPQAGLKTARLGVEPSKPDRIG